MKILPVAPGHDPGDAAATALDGRGEMTSTDDDMPGDAPCFAHDLVNGFPVDPATWRDVNRFRKAERARLLDLRRAQDQDARARQAETIAEALDRIVSPKPGLVIAAYWPIRAELDLRGWMASAQSAGARIALPVVVTRDAPVRFREWTPRCAMERGVWNIPIPSGGDWLTPDVVIAPVLGVDSQGYRLGNGGGYYDRTLAVQDPKPLTIGIGQEFAAMPTIYPMPWDIPMDHVVLGDGTTWPID
ncbi:5-formyltetrahydrofolate cyclo-ligase [Cribrihabitans marinus]|uniref:5-formyltetrahydrofolate cyclo-ligase n=1 Tax=Cribrihabitans marinus TaxID=1227549 RepID=A0A1H6V9U2_9RHOB|nr:5-formyltetrahydrofolate cyclo-ligase [Cribrihabitans marinus]GGH26305.1 5-formyltetrahydrofolate cyclo-ligase [Cribrihabitans marinus]SEI99694.1 5-formyltetrahydrofolate cyclo-ligase [Cribrihabitans marinus]